MNKKKKRSFGIVEDKLLETEFFLNQLSSLNRFSYESRYYFSAFVSAARSVTLSLQATMKDVEGFAQWYEQAQSQLKADPLARFFVEVRNDSIHKGVNPLNQIPLDLLREDLFNQLYGHDRGHVLILPNLYLQDSSVLGDAVQLSTAYFVSLVDIIFDCYDLFKYVVDPKWYFTQENFSALGKTYEDALVELGFPPSWAPETFEEEDIWRILRLRQPPCLINDLFQKYIDRVIDEPDDL